MKRYEDTTGLTRETGLFSRLTTTIGRLGTERALGREVSDEEARAYGKRRIAAVLAPVAVVSALVGLDRLDDAQQKRIDALELCVEGRVGHPVELQTDPKSDRLIQPESIYADIEVCLSELNQGS